jgi:dipeptidyl aminopeptidase/acylaminoacyl peptidase
MFSQFVRFGMLVFLFISSMAGLAVAPDNKDPIIPRAVLFGDPKYSQPKISHDGKHLAYMAPCHGVLNVWAGKLGQHKSMHPVTHNKKRGVTTYLWSYDNEHILYVDDYKGNENWRLYQVNIRTGRSKVLFSYQKVQGKIIGLSQKFPEEILIGINRRRADFHDVYRLNIRTGRISLVYENNFFADFISNENLKIVIAVESTKAGGAVIYRLGKNFVKTELLSIEPENILTTTPLSLNKTGDVLYLLDSRNRNTAALTSLDLRTKVTQLIAENQKADLDEVLFHPSDLTPQGYRFTYEKQSWSALTSSFQEDIAYLNNVDPGEFNIINSSLDYQKWIVAYDRDIGSPHYYYYDRTLKKAYFLFAGRPSLDQLPLTKMKTVIITSRDNLPLVSYLSIPRWERLKKYATMPSIPMVLLVHGGPNARDFWGYNSTHQWLANRGYAVLSVNFRGSSGFGKNFANAGNGEWGAKMQDDLVDAVEWAIGKGIATREKVAIMGGSYGGYATLMGISKTPDLFACGVDIVGPSNLQTLMQSIPEYWKPFYFVLKRMIGGEPTSPEGRTFLADRSPITYIHNIKKPLLIGHGVHDPRVKQEESEQIVNLLLAKHIPVTYLLYPDEGHGFRIPENRLSFYAIAENFLAQNLDGRAEPIKKKDLNNSSIQIKAGKEYITALKK